MKRLNLLFLALFLLLLPKQVSADEGWVIERFNSDITIERSGEVKIVETIDVDFLTLEKHGIYRDIPYIYEANGQKTYSEIDSDKILQNGKKAKVSKSRSDGYVRLKIGDADKTISGKNIYEIQYRVKGVLRGFPEHDELFWNVTGNNWPVEIKKAQASVSLPDAGFKKITCFEGYAGSTDECKILGESSTAVKFESSDTLGEAQGLTIAVGYEKGLIPLLTVERPKTFWEKFIEWPSITTLASVLFFGVGTVIYLWNKNGRDYWFGQNIFGKKEELGSVKPIGAHETIVVEFIPPEKLRPAEIGVLMDERADTHDVVATIIDLAARGFLTITEVPKKWMFGKIDYKLNKKTASTSKVAKANAAAEKKLLGYEKMLLDELFESGQEIKVSDLKKTFYDELKKIKEELYKEVVAKNLFPSNPEHIRSNYLGVGVIIIFVGFFLIGYTVSFDNVYLADLLLGLIVVGIILVLFSRHMPRRSAYGREFYRRIRGYRMFIDKAESHRQKFFEKKNLFNEVFPYAIVFGLTGKFAAAMQEIGLKPAQTGWYVGSHPFSMGNFESSMSGFSNSMSSAIASTPSSSGGFSGGGSSGGGFGGGGGGSW